MVKEKQTRTYDADGFRRRAACLCVRDVDESEILLVTSSRMTDHWIVPGGGVEPNEDASDAAIRETEEEAGVRGVIKRSLGDVEVLDKNKERKHKTSVYVLQVSEELDEWEDCKSRLRRWFPLEEAIKLLSIHKLVHCTYIRLMIETSSALRPSAPRLLSLVASLLKQQPTTSATTIFSASEGGVCKGASTGATDAEQQYLQVNHYPSDVGSGSSGSGNNNAHFSAFICSRDVYSTDSDTAEDLLGGGGGGASANHYAGVNAEGENGNATTDTASGAAKKSTATTTTELFPQSSVNS